MTLDHCTVTPTGMGATPFSGAGNDLAISLERGCAGLPEGPGPEQMVAVLEGRLRLVCPDEVHELAAGDGILIPEGLACRWEMLEPALVYRVATK